MVGLTNKLTMNHYKFASKMIVLIFFDSLFYPLPDYIMMIIVVTRVRGNSSKTQL